MPASLAPATPDADLTATLRRAAALHLFSAALATRAGRACVALLRAAGGMERPEAAAGAYARLFAELAGEGWAGDAWRAHLAAAVAGDANAFTLAADPGPGLRAAAALDLDVLERLARADVLELARERLAQAGIAVASCRDLGGRRPEGLAARLAGAGDWAALAGELRAHALGGGAGRFAAHIAYRWEPDMGRRGGVEPVTRPDLPRLADLWGYTFERGLVADNTERFLAGLPAQDVLLYGDRGTGKSSTVKALLEAHRGRGLRLIELGRRALPMLPRVWDAIDGAPQRFIVFVDDLSFEEGETDYKDAKAALQGGVRARPANALVYATSNRRHLVRERLSERPAPGQARPQRAAEAAGAADALDDPRSGDAVEEKLSLSDRFGLTVVFAAPDQALFLEIVRHIAARRGLDVPEGELRSRALRWTLWQGGRSGRAARQFVDALEAEVGEARP